ncbi:hypothetical protein ENUP19_0257G0091 [Entamoeba nuttalli]|uniref:Rho-GAP domain-containing protein n=1 Tax=Entamoeba nuttalli TaxID=412467 RepID=A0ABQ0DS30_9EUKA
MSETKTTNELIEPIHKKSKVIDKLFKKEQSLPQLSQHQITNPVEFPIQRSLSPPVLLDDFGDIGLTSVIEIDDEYLIQTKAFIKDSKNKIHQIVMGNDTYNIWLEYSKTQNFSMFNKWNNFLITKFTDRTKRPVIIINADEFQLKDYSFNENQIKLFYLYLINKLDQYVNQEYIIVYIDSNDSLPLQLFKSLYRLFPEKYHNNLYYILLLMPETVKLKFTTSLLPLETISKIKLIKDIYDLYEDIPVGVIQLPQWALLSYTSIPHPIFGISLKEANKSNNRGRSGIPLVIEFGIQYFSANVDAFTTEGIFRMSGNKERVDQYIEAFNHCRITSFPLDEDPHIVTSVMKTYLQSLPEPLLTANIGQEVQLIMIASVPNNTTTSQLKELILQIPNENRQLLLALVNLAHLISTQQQFNKMDRVNMGTIFGPYIFWKEYSMKSISEVKCVNALFTYLITNISDFIDVMLD